MFYLARLTSSSSHSLAATIGYATSGALGWRASLEPADGVVPHVNPVPQRLPAVTSRPKFSASPPVPGVLSLVPIERRFACTAEIF